jgi:hypothetical protein
MEIVQSDLDDGETLAKAGSGADIVLSEPDSELALIEIIC